MSDIDQTVSPVASMEAVKVAKSLNQAFDGEGAGPVLRGLAFRMLGLQYNGERDVYRALGWPLRPTYKQYLGYFRRGNIAKRVVKAPVSATWKDIPQILEKEKSGDESQFENSWNDLVSDKVLKFWTQIKRADLLSGIGHYGVLFLGFNDTAKLSEPVVPSSALRLLYMTPLGQESADIKKIGKDPKDSRFGLPEKYSLNFASDNPVSGGIGLSKTVHWSRVIHVGEGFLENDVYGTPRLEAVINLIIGMDLVVGGSSEGYWRMGFPGLNFSLDKDMEKPDDVEAFTTKVEAFVHGLQRYIQTQGIDVKSIQGKLEDPTKASDLLITLIAGTTGIPKRELTGSERGDLASTQDKGTWAETIRERRNEVAEDVILDQLIIRLITLGVIADAPKGWEYIWPNLHSLSAKDKAEVTVKRAEAISKYADSLGSSRVVPPKFFLKNEMEYTDEQLAEMKKELDELEDELKKEADQIAEDSRILEEEEGQEEEGA
jgi:hypothetical protein